MFDSQKYYGGTMTDPKPSNGSLICTFADCPDRQKNCSPFRPYCEFGTDEGWVTTDDGDEVKTFLHPCWWKLLTNGCPRGFAP
jgi:hypothetical protein